MAEEDFRVWRGGREGGAAVPSEQMFASLFDEPASPEQVQLFDVRFPAATILGLHWHSQGLAACVTEGAVEFVFDTSNVVLEPGDCIWIRSTVPHDERSPDGAVMTFAHLAPFENIYP